MSEAELINALVAAHRAGTHPVDGALFAGLDRAAAYRIQDGVTAGLGASVGMLKTAILPDGTGAAGAIYAQHVGRAGFRLPIANVLGLELEVGLLLGKDVPADATAIATYVDHYFTGIEIVGSRYADRSKAGPLGGMADNFASLGYVIGTEPRPLRDTLDGANAILEFAGRQIWSAPAKHSFGTVLASLAAYAKAQHAAYPLKAGTIITTGSLCGLVPTSGPGHVVGRLGDDRVEFDLV
jgi:2-keto-4-pentenoate hydratase